MPLVLRLATRTAAAATGSSGSDRPLLFLLADVPSGTVLFIGRVADPSAG